MSLTLHSPPAAPRAASGLTGRLSRWALALMLAGGAALGRQREWV